MRDGRVNSGCGMASRRGGLIVCAALAFGGAAAAQTPLPDPPGYTLQRHGSRGDFDYFAGAWSTQQRRLRERGRGSADWEEFPATLCMTPYLDGLVTADELVFPTKGWAGFTVRTFDLEKRQWSIYWINSRTGVLEPPVMGGFAGDEGIFRGKDTDEGRPIEVIFRWTRFGSHAARWEQAFSLDGEAWETNWVMNMTRREG